MNILEERGYFWWHDEAVPENAFAPDSSVTGTLTIDEEGTIKLELDGYFSSEKRSPLSVLEEDDDQICSEKAIQGRLKGSSRHVLLLSIRKAGSQFRSNGISYEGFAAAACLVGAHKFPDGAKAFESSLLTIDLAGLESWLCLGNIKIERTREDISMSHRIPAPDVYSLDDGILTMRYDISAPCFVDAKRTVDRANFIESVELQFEPTAIKSLKQMKDEYLSMRDLLILLIGKECRLGWPVLKVGDGHYQYYFEGGGRVTGDAPTWDLCWTNYLKLRLSFGGIVNSWKRKREEFGPGFYLYLGIRRGMQLYIEHQFVMLIWGLESFHRKKNPPAGNTKLESKIARILGQISKKRDRDWLEDRLKNAGEPSLQQRLLSVFSDLPLDLDAKKLSEFCKECADRRNDISHFGGERYTGSRQDFLSDLIKKSEAISYLYHALLLNEIGVAPDILRDFLFQGYSSFRSKFAFKTAGLI